MPLVLTSDYSHPPYDFTKSPIENARAQERYAIGRINDVVEKDGVWDAIIKVTNPFARQAIENNDIPFFVSARVFHNPDEPIDQIEDWAALHLAVVDKPAYGVEKAQFKGLCYGESEQCKIALKEAKTEDCGFCVKSALEALVTNHSISSLSSLSHEAQNSQASMGDSPQTVQNIDLSGYVPKGDYEALKAEFTAKAAAFEEARKQDAARLAAIELEATTNKIQSILSAKIADKEELGKKVKYFVDAKVSPDVVSEAFKLVPDIAKKDNTELFAAPLEAKSKRPSFSYRDYERTIIKGASN